MTTVLRNHPIARGNLDLLGLSILGFIMSMLMGLPSEGMRMFVTGCGIELAPQQYTLVWFTTTAFLCFTFLVTQMIHIDRKWLDWPRWAQVHTLLVAAVTYGILLQSLKLVVSIWE